MISAGVMALLGRVVEVDESGPMSRAEAATEVAVTAPQLPAEVDEALNLLLTSPGWEAVDAIRRAVAEARLWQIGSERFVNVVADITRRGLLADASAASILASCMHPTRLELSPAARHLVEVADAVAEDAREGFIGVNEDNAFRNALIGVAQTRGG